MAAEARQEHHNAAHLMRSADSSICSPSMGLLCMPGEAVGLFAGARRKALWGIPIVSRLMDRDQYEWLRCRLRRILPLLELQVTPRPLILMSKDNYM